MFLETRVCDYCEEEKPVTAFRGNRKDCRTCVPKRLKARKEEAARWKFVAGHLFIELTPGR